MNVVARVVLILMLAAMGANATEFTDAVRQGNLAQVKSLLEANPAVLNDRTEIGQTAMHLAAYNNHREILEYLISKGGDVNVRSTSGSITLHGAGLHGHQEMVRYLISKGADINAVNNAGYTPLLSSAAGGQMANVQILKEAGADINARTRDGKTALHYAAQAGNIETVNALMGLGIDPKIADSGGYTFLHSAVVGGDTNIVKLALERGLDANALTSEGFPPAVEAIASWNFQTLPILIRGGADVNTVLRGGNTLLHMLSWARPDIVTDQNRLTIASFMIERGANVRAVGNEGNTALHFAAQHCDSNYIKLLIDAGADVNAANTQGGTPLMAAASKGAGSNVSFLLSRGAKTDLKERQFGAEALHAAVISGDVATVQALLPAVKNLSPTDNSGRTPLDYANKYGHKGIASLLQAKGAKAKAVPMLVDQSRALKQPLNPGEVMLYYLNHCGWAMKTQNHLLVFDYYSTDHVSDPGLANGHVVPPEIADLNVEVFVTHEHGDHHDSVIYSWQPAVANMSYIFGFHPEALPEQQRGGYRGQSYEYIGPRERKTMDGMTISTIRANDAGVGFLVEVDGLRIYHAGDHGGWLPDQRAGFISEIDYLDSLIGSVDVALVNVTGCHHQDTAALLEGNLYTIEKLSPKLLIPTHAMERPSVYQQFAEKVHGRYPDQEVFAPEGRGDALMFKAKNGRAEVSPL